jgi:hypothetical protein
MGAFYGKFLAPMAWDPLWEIAPAKIFEKFFKKLLTN